MPKIPHFPPPFWFLGIYRPKTSSQHIFVSRFVFSGQFGHRKHSFTSNLAKKGIICPTLLKVSLISCRHNSRRWTCWTASEAWTSTYIYISSVWRRLSWSTTCAMPCRARRPPVQPLTVGVSSSVWNDFADFSVFCLSQTTSKRWRLSTVMPVDWAPPRSSTLN